MKTRGFISLLMAFILIITVAVSSRAFISQAKAPEGDYGYISIKINEGDTLNSIASDYVNFTYYNHSQMVREIERLNRLSSDLIITGSYLVVPVLIEE